MTNRHAIVAVLALSLPARAYAEPAAPAHVPALVMAQKDTSGPSDHAPAQAALPPAGLSENGMVVAGKHNDGASPSPVTPAPDLGVSARLPPPVMPPPIRLISPSAPLSVKERHGATLARRWRNRRELPQRSEDGVVRYLFGSTQASVVCAPLMVCDLALQAGEVVQNINSGDTVDWKLSPAISGVGDSRVTHVIIKPVDAGLVTSMVITTTRRVYSIKLISTQHEWMPLVAFNYPDDTKAQWAAYQATSSIPSGDSSSGASRSGGDLDFGYGLSGDNPDWKPLRVYTDGVHTYIDLPKASQHQDAPVLVSLNNDGGIFSEATRQVVTYRSVRNGIMADTVLTKAALISGVGSGEIKVIITRDRRP